MPFIARIRNIRRSKHCRVAGCCGNETATRKGAKSLYCRVFMFAHVRRGTNQPPYYMKAEQWQRIYFTFPTIVDIEQFHQCGQPWLFNKYVWVIHTLFIRQRVILTSSLREFCKVWPVTRNGFFLTVYLNAQPSKYNAIHFSYFRIRSQKSVKGEAKQIII